MEGRQVRKVIVTADDFGLSAGVNVGVAAAFTFGVVTSASILVNTPGFPHAAEMARRMPGLALGLHVNLTDGRPLSAPDQVPSLVDGDGCFPGDPELVLRRARPDEVRRELAAQLAAYRQAGLRLTHLNTRHHLHLRSEPLRALLAEAARQHGAYLRWSTDPAPEPIPEGLLAPERTLAECLGHPEGHDALVRLLRTAPAGVSEIVCRPGLVDQELRACSSYLEQRERELAAVTSPVARQACRDEGIDLTSFAGLLQSPTAPLLDTTTLASQYKQPDPWGFDRNVFEVIRHDAMAELALAHRPATVLDLGSGEGHFLDRLLRKAPHVACTGVELVEVAVARARERLGARATLVQDDLMRFVAACRERFDVVVLAEVLYYVADRVDAAFVNRIARLVRPGGAVLLSYPPWRNERFTTLFESGPFVREKQVTVQGHGFFTWILTLEALK